MFSIRIPALALVALNAFAHVPAAAQNGLDRRAVTFIRVTCENENTGAISEAQGSGFIVDKAGAVLTAAHVVKCPSAAGGTSERAKNIEVRVGSPLAPQQVAHIVGLDAAADVALLKIVPALQDYMPLSMCALRNPPPGITITAAGFPAGNEYQPVLGVIGTTEGDAGRWSAAATFEAGMSGGPVAHAGFIVGIVKGGAKDLYSVRTITPIYKASLLLESELGLKLTNCAQLTQPESGDNLKKDGLRGNAEGTVTATVRVGEIVSGQVYEGASRAIGRTDQQGFGETASVQLDGWERNQCDDQVGQRRSFARAFGLLSPPGSNRPGLRMKAEVEARGGHFQSSGEKKLGYWCSGQSHNTPLSNTTKAVAIVELHVRILALVDREDRSRRLRLIWKNGGRGAIKDAKYRVVGPDSRAIDAGIAEDASPVFPAIKPGQYILELTAAVQCAAEGDLDCVARRIEQEAELVVE